MYVFLTLALLLKISRTQFHSKLSLKIKIKIKTKQTASSLVRDKTLHYLNHLWIAAEEHAGTLYKRTIIVPDFPRYLFAYEAGKWSPHTHVHTRCPCVIGPPMTLVKSRCKRRLYFAQSVIISITFLPYYLIIFSFQPSSIQKHILLFFFFFFCGVQHTDCTHSPACTLTLRPLHSLQVFQWRQTGLLCH